MTTVWPIPLHSNDPVQNSKRRLNHMINIYKHLRKYFVSFSGFEMPKRLPRSGDTSEKVFDAKGEEHLSVSLPLRKIDDDISFENSLIDLNIFKDSSFSLRRQNRPIKFNNRTIHRICDPFNPGLLGNPYGATQPRAIAKKWESPLLPDHLNDPFYDGRVCGHGLLRSLPIEEIGLEKDTVTSFYKRLDPSDEINGSPECF